jgi:rhodanese-related sulfurtransferase
MGRFSGGQSIVEVDPLEAQRRMTESNATVVDVRESDEWESGHIPGARHIPLGQIDAYLPVLLKEDEVIFVCHVGSRSAYATMALASAGHTRAANLSGGMVAWEHARLPTTS